MKPSEPSFEYIEYICFLYGDTYDDRVEDCKPPTAGVEYREPGNDWVPGQIANHKSLIAFQRELDAMGIKLSSSKIRKLLITGGCWSTDRSREIGRLFNLYTKPKDEGGKGFIHEEAIVKISEELDISIVTVSVNLPYQNVVYNLENKSSNAKRCARYKERKKKGLTRTLKKK